MKLNDAYAIGISPMRSTWLFTLRIAIDKCTVNLDYYGTEDYGPERRHMLIICSESFNHVTKVIEGWSL